MRLFIGLEPTAEFRQSLAELQAQLLRAGIQGRPLAPSNFHLTLAFIGQWPEDVTAFLPIVNRPFSITLSQPGIFQEAKVLYAGVQPSEELASLAEQVRRNLDHAGIPCDRQPFCPHITLIRKPLLPCASVLTSIPFSPVSMTVREVCLYSSVHERTGMVYTVIGRSGERG